MSQTVDERFSVALHSTARGWRIGLDRHLKSLGLGQAGWLTIAVIARANEPMSQTELANAVGVESATMVSMLDRLERDGLVKRQPSPTDRRIKLIFLTKEGKANYGKVRTEANIYRHELLDGIEDSELEQTIALLDRIRKKIEAAR